MYPSRSTLQNDLYQVCNYTVECDVSDYFTYDCWKQLSIAPDGESCTWQLIPTSSPRPCERMKVGSADVFHLGVGVLHNP